MKEMFARICFALWIRFGLEMFEEATVYAPEGKVIGVKFGEQPSPPSFFTYSNTVDKSNWIFTSGGDDVERVSTT